MKDMGYHSGSCGYSDIIRGIATVPPPTICWECGKPVTKLCAENSQWYCAECAAKRDDLTFYERKEEAPTFRAEAERTEPMT